MTIRNYTFFSPNGNDFPVSANGDAKLYMLLAGNSYSQFIVRNWQNPTITGLNKIYQATSVLLAGRYFELNYEPVTLLPNTVNYVHVNIDISNTSKPVSLTVERTDNSNSNDINIGNSVIKRCIDQVTTNQNTVISSVTPEQERNFDSLNLNKVNAKTLNVTDSVSEPVAVTLFKLPYMNNNGSRLTRVGNMVICDGSFSSTIARGAGPLIANGSYATEIIPAGFRPLNDDRDIFWNYRTINDGATAGRIRIQSDGRMTDMYLLNKGLDTTSAMILNTSWATKDDFPTNNIV